MTEAFIDTNYFIRYFVSDIPEQFEKAKETFGAIEQTRLQGNISLLVVNEVIWIMEHYYKLKRTVYLPPLMKLLLLQNMRIIETKKEIVLAALQAMKRRKIDFTDAYLLQIVPQGAMYTFDKDFTK